MIRTPLNLGDIASIGYHAPNKILEIEFKTNRIYNYFRASKYRYSEVPKNIYDGIMKSADQAKYLDEEIKGKYDYIKTNY